MKISAIELESRKALGARIENIPQKLNMERTQLIPKNLLSTHFDFRHLISMSVSWYPGQYDNYLDCYNPPPHFIMFMITFTVSSGRMTEWPWSNSFHHSSQHRHWHYLRDWTGTVFWKWEHLWSDGQCMCRIHSQRHNFLVGQESGCYSSLKNISVLAVFVVVLIWIFTILKSSLCVIILNFFGEASDFQNWHFQAGCMLPSLTHFNRKRLDN